MDNFEHSIRLPFSDLKKFMIGALLNLLPILNLFSAGYILQCGKSSLKGNDKLPEWQHWGDLFVKGLLVFALTIIYAIPLIILGLIFGGTALMGLITGKTAGIAAALAGLGIFALIGGLYGLLLVYILPAAILNYAKHDSFGAGLHFGEVFSRAFTGKYFVQWIVAFLVSFVMMFVAGLISVIPIVGWLVAAATGFFVGVFMITMVAQAMK